MASKSAAKTWFITTVVTFVVQLLVALGATIVAGPGIYPEYDAEVVRNGVFVLATVPVLDILRQYSSGQAHLRKRWRLYTQPLRASNVSIAVVTAVVMVAVAMTIPWLVIPVFVALIVIVWISANF